MDNDSVQAEVASLWWYGTSREILIENICILL